MKHHILAPTLLVTAGLLGAAPRAQDQATPAEAAAPLESAAASLQAELESSLQELDALRTRIADEKIPLTRELDALESELLEVRGEYQRVSRLSDSRTLDLGNLTARIKERNDERSYVTGLLTDYLTKFESRLHIAELARYEEALSSARLAAENRELEPGELHAAQAALLDTSLGRLEDALGGTRFEGTAVEPSGIVAEGTFLLLGPTALFRSADGQTVGSAEQRLGSLQPAVIPFPTPEENEAAAGLVVGGQGSFPLDPTLGNAHKVAATQEETFLEHARKGGTVMIPIVALAAAAFLVIVLKWIGMAFVRQPSRKKVQALLTALEENDEAGARERVRRIGGPTGRMLTAGVEHLREPTELVEEVMYESMLTTKLRLNRFLPFVAVSAASAPLLGLLGTVTGIIETFKLITVYGSGDVKVLSSGISEALITTEFGLIVAIPSLLLHALLSRKAKAILARMEITAVAFVNQVARLKRDREIVPAGRVAPAGATAPDPELVRKQVGEILEGLLGPLVRENGSASVAQVSAKAD